MIHEMCCYVLTVLRSDSDIYGCLKLKWNSGDLIKYNLVGLNTNKNSYVAARHREHLYSQQQNTFLITFLFVYNT